MDRLYNSHRRYLTTRYKGGKRLHLLDQDLTGLDLSYAILCSAKFVGCNLTKTKFYNTNARYAEFVNCNFTDAHLTACTFSRSWLHDCKFTGADVSCCDFVESEILRADFSTTTGLHTAVFTGADIQNCIFPPKSRVLTRTEILPREGEVIGWKKCRDGVVVKLRITPKAKRSNALGRKCRASEAEVLKIIGAKVAYSKHDADFEYEVGKTVKPRKKWDPNRFEECASGIHFFLTREEAEAY